MVSSIFYFFISVYAIYISFHLQMESWYMESKWHKNDGAVYTFKRQMIKVPLAFLKCRYYVDNKNIRKYLYVLLIIKSRTAPFTIVMVDSSYLFSS